MSVASVDAGNTVGGIVQNAATANGNGTMVTTFGTFLVATYSVSGTFTATVNFEGAGADGAFQQLGCVPITGGPAVSSTTVAGAWRCNIVAFLTLRARISQYVSGSVTVSLQATDFGSVFVGPPSDTGAGGVPTVPVVLDPVSPQRASLWMSLTTANVLKYFDGTATRSLVDLSLGQTLTNKTLPAPTITDPTISGVITGAPIWTTPLGAVSGGTGLNTAGATGTPHVSGGTWRITDLRAEPYPFILAVPPAIPGRLAYQSVGSPSLQLDTGLQWVQLDDLASPNTLRNKTLASTVAIGVNRAPPTVAGRYAATHAANSGTMLTLTRSTDTAPAGNFLDFQSAAAASLFTLDVTGKTTTYGGATPTDGQVLIGGTAAGNFTAATLTGTANRVVVTNGNNTVTLSTPQDIATTSSPTFTNLTLSGLAAANAFIFDNNTGQIVSTPATTNGQLLIGATAGAPAAATLTAGNAITITNGANSITVANGIAASTGTATIGTCGTSPTMISGSTDSYGGVNIGTGAVTACTVNFSKTLSAAPFCTIADNSTTVTPDVSSVSTTAVTFSFSASIGGGVLYYHCFGGT